MYTCSCILSNNRISEYIKKKFCVVICFRLFLVFVSLLPVSVPLLRSTPYMEGESDWSNTIYIQ